MRGFARKLHRYAGLTLALFLVIVGLTGSALAFYEELDAWLNPDLMHVPPGRPALSASELVSRIEAWDDRMRVTNVTLPGDSVPLEGSAADVIYRLQFPIHSGQILGLPGRIIVFLAGIVTAVLSVTGVVIWALGVRRRARQRERNGQRREPAGGPLPGRRLAASGTSLLAPPGEPSGGP